MKIRYTLESRKDLLSIKQYISENLYNPTAAQAVITKIIRSCGMLKEQPHMGMPLAGKIGRETDLKYWITGKYIVFYRENEEYISIIRILDTRTDYLRILFEEER